MEAGGDLAERMCIVTRKCQDESALLRFVRSPEGDVVPDLDRRLPGRGVWVGLDRGLVAEATKKRLFSKAFAAESRAADDLPGLVGNLLRKAALSYISLAKKAGEAVSGFTKVEEMLGRERARILIHAAEAKPDGRRKLDKMAMAETVIMTRFSVDELSLAFGHPNVIHAAVAKGGLAEKLLAAVKRIEIYEAQTGPEGVEERA